LLFPSAEPGFGRLADISSVCRRHRIGTRNPPKGAVPVAGTVLQFAQQERNDSRSHSNDLLERRVAN
jgi:hypothetical protein